MFSLFRQVGRQKGLKPRRSRRNRRVAKIVAPAVITTALLIPIISGLIGDPATSDATSSSSTSSSSSDSGTTSTSGSNAGTTTSSDSGSGTDSAASGSSSSTTVAGSDSGGSSTTGNGSSSTPGDLSGLVLIFEEDPASSTESDPATTTTSGSDTTSSGTEVTATGSAFDEYPPLDLITIEEDWELNITQPDAALGAPQVGTVMTPFEDSGDFYLAFVVNHRFNPTYSAGGMELQLWYQGQQLGWLTFGEGVLSNPNETVKWTQRLELKQGKLRFSIVKGTSSTWGDFGAGESMHLELATTLIDLNDYHPNVSAENSGVVFASNRIGSLWLKKVRGYDKHGGLVLQDTDPVLVFALGQ